MRAHLTSWRDLRPVFWQEEAALWANTAGQWPKDAVSNVTIDVPMLFFMTITRAIPTKIIKQFAFSPKSVLLLSCYYSSFGSERIGSLIKHVKVYLSCHKTTASFYGTVWKAACFLPFCCNLKLSSTAPCLTVLPYLSMDLLRCLELRRETLIHLDI